MSKTARDITTEALRRIGVAAHDSAPDAASFDIAEGIYRAMFAELADEGFTELTDANAVPDKAYNAIVQIVANDVAPSFGVQANQQHWREGWRRLRRIYMKDDRSDPADLDNDGTVSAGEAQDDLEAQFF